MEELEALLARARKGANPLDHEGKQVPGLPYDLHTVERQVGGHRVKLWLLEYRDRQHPRYLDSFLSITFTGRERKLDDVRIPHLQTCSLSAKELQYVLQAVEIFSQ